jgi:hypothetical protein
LAGFNENEQGLAMLVIILYRCLLVGNLLLLAAGLYFGPRLGRLFLIVLLVNALALALLLIPILTMLVAPNEPENSTSAVKILFVAAMPLLAEFVALIAVYRWRVGTR